MILHGAKWRKIDRLEENRDGEKMGREKISGRD